MSLCVIEECGAPVRYKSRGLCNTHYLRLRLKGDPRAAVIERRPSHVPFEEWFWNRFTPNGACWDWQGTPNVPSGYGRTTTPDGRRLGTHVVSWILTHGEVPPGLCVCHTCDRPICGNPDHLFLDTDSGNAADKVSKGRQTKGMGFPHAKLTEHDVVEILYYLADGHSQSETAAAFGVSRSAIESIWLGRTWRWVTR